MCKDPPRHTETFRLPLTLQQSAAFTYLLPEGSPNHFAVFACPPSLSVGGRASTFTALSSQPLKQGEEARAVGRMFKDVFHPRLSKGKNAVRSC